MKIFIILVDCVLEHLIWFEIVINSFSFIDDILWLLLMTEQIFFSVKR